jgi:glycerate kinase
LTEGQEHRIAEIGRRERLNQVTCDPDRTATGDIGASDVRGQQHDGHSGEVWLLSNALRHGEAVQVRHVSIE